MKVAITGGHLTPALATISALKRKRSGIEFIFFGRKHSLEGDQSISFEYEIVKNLGIKFITLTTGRIQRRLTKYTILSLLKIPLGFPQAFYYLLREKPDIILSFGGYLSVPVVLAGWFCGIPSITHEQTVRISLSTRINSLFCQKVAVSWRETLKFVSKKKRVLTGNPIREEIFQKEEANPTIRLFIERIRKQKKRLIFITGGNLGSHSINITVKKIVGKLDQKYAVIHQTGRSEVFKDCNLLQKEAKRKKVKNYFLTEYLAGEDMGAILNACDLVVGRAGANTIAELAALGKISILIPLPWSGGGEQRENARILEKVGIAQIILQENLTPQVLFEAIEKMVRNFKDYKRNRILAQKLVVLNAADKLAKEVLGFYQ